MSESTNNTSNQEALLIPFSDILDSQSVAFKLPQTDNAKKGSRWQDLRACRFQIESHQIIERDRTKTVARLREPTSVWGALGKDTCKISDIIFTSVSPSKFDSNSKAELKLTGKLDIGSSAVTVSIPLDDSTLIDADVQNVEIQSVLQFFGDLIIDHSVRVVPGEAQQVIGTNAHNTLPCAVKGTRRNAVGVRGAQIQIDFGLTPCVRFVAQFPPMPNPEDRRGSLISLDLSALHDRSGSLKVKFSYASRSTGTSVARTYNVTYPYGPFVCLDEEAKRMPSTTREAFYFGMAGLVYTMMATLVANGVSAAEAAQDGIFFTREITEEAARAGNPRAMEVLQPRIPRVLPDEAHVVINQARALGLRQRDIATGIFRAALTRQTTVPV